MKHPHSCVVRSFPKKKAIEGTLLSKETWNTLAKRYFWKWSPIRWFTNRFFVETNCNLVYLPKNIYFDHSWNNFSLRVHDCLSQSLYGRWTRGNPNLRKICHHVLVLPCNTKRMENGCRWRIGQLVNIPCMLPILQYQRGTWAPWKAWFPNTKSMKIFSTVSNWAMQTNLYSQRL